ncbi:hypothetical protein ACOSQ2_032508 [Xanthoceras sorbifolium]
MVPTDSDKAKRRIGNPINHGGHQHLVATGKPKGISHDFQIPQINPRGERRENILLTTYPPISSLREAVQYLHTIYHLYFSRLVEIIDLGYYNCPQDTSLKQSSPLVTRDKSLDPSILAAPLTARTRHLQQKESLSQITKR